MTISARNSNHDEPAISLTDNRVGIRQRGSGGHSAGNYILDSLAILD